MTPVVGVVPKDFRPLEYEPEVLRLFARERVRERRRELADRGKRFYFLDGPPYVTNPVHVGTAWNKVIKDVVIRFKAMQGFSVRDQPGYDMHGLPIEVVVERELGIRTKADIRRTVGVRRFVEACRRKAMENLRLQNQQFIDLGVSMDWDNPYVTLTNEWIEAVWWLIKRAYERGLLERREKVVHWCPRCETVLSHHEVAQEYRDVEDPSVYVKFPVVGREGTYILIWTTTPWTIPANLAVMVHPDEEYVEALVEGDRLILARKRLAVLDEIGLGYEVVRSCRGGDLEGLRYEFPLLEEVPRQRGFADAHRVVTSAEHVTMEEGTGCVHSAPGHGEEDYEVGVREGLPVFSPIDDEGRFTADAGRYAGLRVFEANDAVLRDLEGKGLLLFSGRVVHKYPHCWRCKTKLVLRSTPQWFILVSRMRDDLLRENEGIEWVPDWAGKARFRRWLEGARDWVISRQRYWGTPLPIWVCGDCGREAVIGSIEELRRRAVSIPSPLDLHRPWVDEIRLRCDCGGTMERVPDLVDVWMDSGVAAWACLGFPRRDDELREWWPSDFITEGPDQTRGWFYTLLISGLIGFDRSPYRRVLMHGWTLDEGGVAMHKSLGNIILPGEVIERYGRDALRLYELQSTPWDDLRFSWRGVKESLGTLQIMWNVFHFATLYMNLDGFDPRAHPLEGLWPDLGPEGRWLVSRLERLKRSVTEHLEGLHLHVALGDLVDFVLNDLSRWYVRLVRRHFWEERESATKLATYATLYYVLKNVLVLSAPFVPFIAEKIYQSAFRAVEGVESVHLMRWPEAREGWVDPDLEGEMEIVRRMVAGVLSARQKAGLKLRQPVASVTFVAERPEVADVARRYEGILRAQANARRVEAVGVDEEGRLRRIAASPVLSRIGPVFKRKARRVAELIEAADGEAMERAFGERGFFELRLDGEAVRILPEYVSFREEVAEGFVRGEFEGGRAYVDVRLTPELRAEGLSRDLVRRMQYMRKVLDLRVEEFVDAYVVAPVDLGPLRGFEGYIKQEVRARELTLSSGPAPWRADLEREWAIDGRPFTIGIRRLPSEA